MPNTWVAVDAGVDPVHWARLLRLAYNRALGGEASALREPQTIVRPIIAASWARSIAAGAEIDRRPPLMLSTEEAVRSLRRPPMAAIVSLVRPRLTPVAQYARQTVAIADGAGHILSVTGHPEACAAARQVNLMAGALWSESACGTNAVGTAIALDHPVQVFSAEHFKHRLHGWSCAAAPVHDPETHRLLAVIALAGPFKHAHPHGFSLVVAAAESAETQLRHDASQRDERLKVEYLEGVLGGSFDASAVVNPLGQVLLATPAGWLGSRLALSADGIPLAPYTAEVRVEAMRREKGFMIIRESRRGGRCAASVLRLRALGVERATASLGRRSFEFTPRHSEILVLLACHPQGLSDEELGIALYGRPTKSVTVRAEISRLRRLLGSGIRTRPYRLILDVEADFLKPPTASDHGRAAGPLASPPGRLLPSSRAPGIVEMRHRIDGAVGAPAPHAGPAAVHDAF